MAGFEWKTGARVVRCLLAGERVDDMDREHVTLAIGYGLIESLEQTKPCAACGKPKLDFRYWKATPAGRLLADALGDDQ